MPFSLIPIMSDHQLIVLFLLTKEGALSILLVHLGNQGT